MRSAITPAGAWRKTLFGEEVIFIAAENSIVRVAVDKTGPGFDKLYDYRLPAEMSGAAPGTRVIVPFGQGNRKRQAMVLETEVADSGLRLKAVAELIDAAPVLNGEQLLLLRHIKEQTLCTWYDAVKLMIPGGLGLDFDFEFSINSQWLTSEGALSPDEEAVFSYIAARRKAVSRKLLLKHFGFADDRILRGMTQKGALLASEKSKRRIMDETVTMISLALDSDEAARLLQSEVFTPKQQRVIELLLSVGPVSIKEAVYFTASSKAVIDLMLKKGYIQKYDNIILRNPYQNRTSTKQPPSPLNDEQQAAAEGIIGLLEKGGAHTALLHGVTGSGKTQVYLNAVSAAIELGKTAIVLVPEIALTTQTLKKFHDRYGELVAVMHSGLTLSQRLDEWKRIRSGAAKVVLGTRSAVFAPLQNIGLIVMDEEQESSYKSDSSPRYHARHVALTRAKLNNALLLLCSATPSIESAHHAKSGRYSYFKLEKRYADSRLPKVTIIDMNGQSKLSQVAEISDLLLEEISINLEAQKQTILLLNRRGYNTIVRCAECKTVQKCPNCSIALTFHRANERLMCHYCGHSVSAHGNCPDCQSKFVRFSGTGTQRIEELLQAHFPQARVLRMDSDTTMAKFSFDRYFEEFAQHKYDIMLGTQMVSKGLNFPDVTLVGVLQADLALFTDDFRGYERTFNLLTQVVGRSGRGQDPGRAFIQTFNPDHPILRMAAMQDYESFYKEEITARELLLYPPFCEICAVVVSSEKEEAAKNAAKQFLDELAESAGAEAGVPIKVLGPSETAVFKMNKKYRYKLLVKSRNTRRFRRLIEKVLAGVQAKPENKEVALYSDFYFDGIV